MFDNDDMTYLRYLVKTRLIGIAVEYLFFINSSHYNFEFGERQLILLVEFVVLNILVCIFD